MWQYEGQQPTVALPPKPQARVLGRMKILLSNLLRSIFSTRCVHQRFEAMQTGFNAHRTRLDAEWCSWLGGCKGLHVHAIMRTPGPYLACT